MSINSKIEWTDATWNPVTGCTKISAGCKNCYAERMAKRLSCIPGSGYPKLHPFKVTLRSEKLEEPRRWRKPRKVFVCSMGDLFHEKVPFKFIARVFANMIEPHTYLILTKRPEKMKAFFDSIGEYEGWITHNGNPPDCYGGDGIIIGSADSWPKKNTWLGVTAENQARADNRIPILLKIPVAIHFVSIEPMLGPVDFGDRRLEWLSPFKETDAMLNRTPRIDWVICGGESGPGARPMHQSWVHSLRDQCTEANTPFFFKQWGEWAPDGEIIMHCVGKKNAGRLLDGKEYNEYPEKLFKK